MLKFLAIFLCMFANTVFSKTVFVFDDITSNIYQYQRITGVQEARTIYITKRFWSKSELSEVYREISIQFKPTDQIVYVSSDLTSVFKSFDINRLQTFLHSSSYGYNSILILEDTHKRLPIVSKVLDDLAGKPVEVVQVSSSFDLDRAISRSNLNSRQVVLNFVTIYKDADTGATLSYADSSRTILRTSKNLVFGLTNRHDICLCAQFNYTNKLNVDFVLTLNTARLKRHNSEVLYSGIVNAQEIVFE